MSPPNEPNSSSTSIISTPNIKRRRTCSVDDENKKSPKQTQIFELPPPMVTSASTSTSLPASPSFILNTTAIHAPVAYYPVYTTHTGHFYIASPPLHPNVPPSTHPLTKIFPKLPPNHQPPLTPVTLSSLSSSSTSYSYYHHPYHTTSSPIIQPIYSSGTTRAATTAVEREQARRQSHSAIEKRRREKLNDKIMQLKQLIPTCADQENLNKMSILQSTIEYITYLKDIMEKMDDNNEGDVDDQPIKLNWDLNNKKKSGIESSEVEPYTSQFRVQQSTTTTTTTEATTSLLSNKDDIQDPNDNGSTTETSKNMSLENMLC